MNFVFKKIKNLTFLFLIFLDFNLSSNAYMKGTLSTGKEAQKKSLKLGRKGVHKNQAKWLPCANEKESIRYLKK